MVRVCTGPKAPYVTEFIDHPGTELRLWPWQSWQYGVSGILVWATVYWSSPLAYPEPNVQDPWVDPMSWVTGYGNSGRLPQSLGQRRRSLPLPAAARSQRLDRAQPRCADQLASVGEPAGRHGGLRVPLAARSGGEARRDREASSALVREARGLLEVPESVSKDLTTSRPIRGPFCASPSVARTIERLRRIE